MNPCRTQLGKIFHFIYTPFGEKIKKVKFFQSLFFWNEQWKIIVKQRKNVLISSLKLKFYISKHVGIYFFFPFMYISY